MAGLNCERHGGPNKIAAQEMVYWEDILSDNKYTSPFHPQQQHPKGEDGQTGSHLFRASTREWKCIVCRPKIMLNPNGCNILMIVFANNLIQIVSLDGYLVPILDQISPNAFFFCRFMTVLLKGRTLNYPGCKC